MEIIIWVLIVLLLIIASYITVDVKKILYALGGVVAIVLKLFKVSFIFQFLSFIILGFIFTYLFNDKLSHWYKNKCDNIAKKMKKRKKEEIN